MKKTLLLLGFLFLGFTGLQAVDNHHVDGYPKPEVCLKSNIRCILKKQGKRKYWCLKSNHQRVLDARRTTSPIKKTPKEILGHCAQIIPIREEVAQ